MNNRTASVYFKPDPHRDGWSYREGYWIYKQGDDEHQFEKFSQDYGKDAESFSQIQLDLDKVDVVYIYSKTGDLRYTKQGIQYKNPDEILKIAKTYLRRDRERDNSLYELYECRQQLRVAESEVKQLRSIYDFYKSKAQKYDQIMEVLT